MSGTVADPTEQETAEPDRSLMVHGRCALVAVVAGGGLAYASSVSALGLLVAIAVLQAALIVTWVFGTGMPGRWGALAISAAAAAGADVAVSQWPHRDLAPLMTVLGLLLPVMFLHQLTRGVVRVRTVESMSKVALLSLAVVALPCVLQLRHEFDGSDMATAGLLAVAAALVAGHFGDMVWSRPRFDADIPRGLVAFCVGLIAGGAAGSRIFDNVVAFTTARAIYVSIAIGAVVGLLAIASAFIVHHVPETATVDEPHREGRPALLPVAQTLLVIALSAPAVYVLAITGHG